MEYKINECFISILHTFTISSSCTANEAMRGLEPLGYSVEKRQRAFNWATSHFPVELI